MDLDLERRNNVFKYNRKCSCLSLPDPWQEEEEEEIRSNQHGEHRLTYITANTVNGATADIALTTHGSNFYFAICGVMGFAGFAFVAMSFKVERRNRLFHYITSAVVFVAAIAYFTMGSNLGFTPIEVEFKRSDAVVRGTYRAIYYARYIDWFITTPLLLMDLLLTAGMPWPTILWVVVVDEIMIVTGLIGALIRSIYKWPYFVFG